MLDWFITAAVLIIGFIIMVTGLIQWVLFGFMAYLLILVIMGILGRIWACFRNPNDK